MLRQQSGAGEGLGNEQHWETGHEGLIIISIREFKSSYADDWTNDNVC